ncbi:MAG: GntR family transcriptional regulator [Rhizorhabdus sp.]
MSVDDPQSPAWRAHGMRANRLAMAKPKTQVARRKRRSSTLPPIERLSELAYRAILAGLFDRRVPAGAFLSQSELMQMVDVPVQPLRDALRLLETEGILKIHPRSGIEFLKADLELARSTYQFRSVIERAAVRAYASSVEAGEIEILIADHRALDERLGAEGTSDAVRTSMEELEGRFHGSLISAMRNPMIETTAQRLKTYVALIRMDVRVTPQMMARTIQEHLDVLEACLTRDAEAAEAALSQHFQAAMQRILGMV